MKPEMKHYLIGAAALIWIFAALIVAVQTFNNGNGFYIVCGVIDIAGIVFLAVKGFKYFTNVLTNQK